MISVQSTPAGSKKMFCVSVTSTGILFAKLVEKSDIDLMLWGYATLNTCITLHEPFILSCTTVAPGI